MAALIKLKTTTTQAEAATGSYGSAAILFTVASNAIPAAQVTFKHTGTAGFWLIQFQRDVVGSGPTTTVYSRKLGPGEEFTEDDPPKGEVWGLHSSANGPLSYYGSWAT